MTLAVERDVKQQINLNPIKKKKLPEHFRGEWSFVLCHSLVETKIISFEIYYKFSL